MTDIAYHGPDYHPWDDPANYPGYDRPLERPNLFINPRDIMPPLDQYDYQQMLLGERLRREHYQRIDEQGLTSYPLRSGVTDMPITDAQIAAYWKDMLVEAWVDPVGRKLRLSTKIGTLIAIEAEDDTGFTYEARYALAYEARFGRPYIDPTSSPLVPAESRGENDENVFRIDYPRTDDGCIPIDAPKKEADRIEDLLMFARYPDAMTVVMRNGEAHHFIGPDYREVQKGFVLQGYLQETQPNALHSVIEWVIESAQPQTVENQ